MIKRLLSVVTTVSLILGVCATSAMGRAGSDPAEPAAKSPPTVKSEAKPNEKLRADVQKLTADAKAGKIVPRKPSPFQPQRNNLSTGAKIAIVAGIGAGIFLIWMFVTLADDDS